MAARAPTSSVRNFVKRAFGASCDRLYPEKYQRSLAALTTTTDASAVVHSAPACSRSRPPWRLANSVQGGRDLLHAGALWTTALAYSRSRPPWRLANSVSPAQNDGSRGVTGDCSVAKK